LEHLLEQMQVKIQQVAVDGMQEFRLIHEGKHQFLEAHEGPGEPKETFDSAPYHRFPSPLLLRPFAHPGDGRAVVGEEVGFHPEVVVHVRDDALDVVLGGFDGGDGGAEPELLVGIEAEEPGDFENLAGFQLAGKTFTMPARDGFVPPHRPFPARQPIHGLEVHDRPETFNVVHWPAGLLKNAVWA